MFEAIPEESFADREQRVLNFWQKEKVFKRSLEQRKDEPLFVFYDGPPFATGLPHYGHLLAGTIKDVVPRYKTMKGYHVPRRFGWDCHGLPVENEIEKTHNLSGASSIEQFGIANFNEECRKIVLRYTEEWKATVNRMGRWVDFDHVYRTMDLSFMESVWWVFKQLYDQGLVYEGFKVMPFSAKLGTPLSNFEATQNYKEVDDPSLTVALPLEEDSNTSLIVWTTTPWTLISNLTVMAGPDIEYVKVRDRQANKHYILAKERLTAYYKGEEEYEIAETFPGRTLEGKRYQPPFDYFVDRAKEGAFRVILEEAVSTEEGTGLVHAAPAFGEVDFYACQKANISLVCPVDNNGKFTEEVPEYAGQFVKDADKDIIRRLRQEGKVVHHGTCHHRYPFCWRSDTPLIYKAVKTWFVAVEKIKERLLAVNEEIHWVPTHLKKGRFGKWLEGARDWAISRNRYWGTPIPLWRSEEGDIRVVGSLSELQGLTNTSVTDIHRHYIDDLTFSENGKVFRRIPEVFDCWFESGSMPYAQNHYPFEEKEHFEKKFPADFIAEGLDQTRGWFYTLTILAVALFDKPAFKNVVVNGIVLAEDGSKMSKRLKNYPDPTRLIHTYGADAIRLYMLNSTAVRADDLRFSEHGVELVLRQVLIPLWNAYSFFITYARIYSWKLKPSHDSKPTAAIDQWMLSVLHKLIHSVEEGMDDYDLSRAVEPFIWFVDQLTNWYIRRSRRRFWEDEETPDRHEAFTTLYQVLLELTKVAAPFIPFMSDAMYRNLRSEEMLLSVHLSDYPEYRPETRNEKLEIEMALVQTTVSLGHALRKEHKMKVRQPLPVAHIVSSNEKTLEFLQDQQHLIAEELNVKRVDFSAEEDRFVSLKAKPNFRLLGKKVGKLMKQVQEAIGQFDRKQLVALMEGHSQTITVEGQNIEITPEEVQVERVVREGMVAANEREITIALETALSEELAIEGLARELVNKINTMRREAGFAVTDRVHVTMETTEKVKSAFEQYRDYICNEVLAFSVSFEPCQGQEWDLNGEPTRITLARAQ